MVSATSYPGLNSPQLGNQALGNEASSAASYSAHLKKVHSEWCSKPLSEFGQKLIPGSRRAANYTLISLLDDRRRHGDHILGTMHTKRGFCLGWLNTDTFLEKCEGGVSASRKKNSILKSYI